MSGILGVQVPYTAWWRRSISDPQGHHREVSRYGYFGFCETPSILAKLDGWIRRRLRSLSWKQWKTPRNRRKELGRSSFA
ncbi:MAG: group II intron maturase-specific domain-containing protein [Thermoplasmatota archaeon]